MTRQGIEEVLTHGGSNASLLEKLMDGWLASEDSLRTADQVRLSVILSVDEALCDLGTFAFLELHLFFVGGFTQHNLQSSSIALRYCRSFTPMCRV